MNDERDQYDLLTAAAIGLVAGAGIALLIRATTNRSPHKKFAKQQVRKAGRAAGRAGVRGAKWAAERGEDLVDRIPFDEIGESIGDYAQSAREAIDDTVSHELNDLKKAIRRHRKRMGI